MKTKFLILAVLAFLISPLFAQESEIIDYPHNLQEFYEKLDEAFPDDTEITSMTMNDWSYFKSSPYRKLIIKWVDFDKNVAFLQNINPIGYKLKDTSYMFILLDCYWNYKNGKTFDFDTRFEEQEVIDFPPPPDYPHTLQEFYEKLDTEFSDYTDITRLSFNSFFNKYRSTIGDRISSWINFKENTEFLQSINPNNYRVHKESYRPILMECYWSYKNGIDYDLDLHFECEDRCSKSHDQPINLPIPDLIRDSIYYDFRYDYKGIETIEYIYIYHLPPEFNNTNVFIYSFHFGWIELTIKEYVNIKKAQNQDRDKIILDYFQTKEKLVF